MSLYSIINRSEQATVKDLYKLKNLQERLSLVVTAPSACYANTNALIPKPFVILFVFGFGKTDLMVIIVDSSYEPKYTLDRLTMVLQIITL